jgi:hypothetical protein
MFKFIIFILMLLIIIGSGDVFDFTSAGDIWTININHQELLTSVIDGFNIVYDFIANLIEGSQETEKATEKTI